VTTSNSGKDEKRAAPAEHRPCRNPETLDRTIKAELVSLFRELESQNRELLLAKADLEISEKKYRDLFESAPIGYFTLDAEGTILEANRAGAAILGKTPAIVTNARFQRFLDPDESKVFSGMVARACSGGKRENCEVRLNFPANPQKRAGTQRWALIEAQATGTVTGRGESIRLAVIDITPRIRAETALRES
jgi:PAS domain S-box-containing protein